MAKKTATANLNGNKHVYQPPCHIGPKLVMTLDNGTKVYAGAFDDVRRKNYGMYVQIFDPFGSRQAGPSPLVWPIAVNEAAKQALPANLTQAPDKPMMVIQWDDYKAPDLTPEWWQGFVNFLSGPDAPASVGIGCLGGHGRTGTSLAIIATLADLVPIGTDPVEWVRKRYCHKAVESDEQLDYIEDVTGRRVVSDAYGVFGAYGASYGSPSKPDYHGK